MPKNLGVSLIPFEIVGNTRGSKAASLLNGFITNALAVFAPIPIVFPVAHKPNLPPRFAAFPTRGIPPPIIKPSCAYFNLFVNLAIARSLPSNPFSFTLPVNNVGLSESDKAISAIDKDKPPLPTLTARSAVPLKYLFFILPIVLLVSSPSFLTFFILLRLPANFKTKVLGRPY